MTRRFVDGVDELLAQVGTGNLTGQVEVSQVYAKYQELREDLRHPRGGQAHYLRDSLMTGAVEYMQRLARGAITREGSDLRGAMVHNVEDIAARQQQLAPILYNVLKRSAHPTVEDDGVTVYDRPPLARRLSEQELKHRPRRGSARPGLRRRR